MSQGLTRTTLIECPRSQSDEGIANNNQNPSKWSNRVGSGLHLKPGDRISVHSSYISEIGAEAGAIQIKGKDLIKIQKNGLDLYQSFPKLTGNF